MLNELTQISWEDFHFLRPVFLWLFIPVVLAMILGLISLKEEVKWRKVIAPHLRPYIIKAGSEGLKRRMQLVMLALLSLAILGLSGPTWRSIELPGKTLETPVVLLLDLSPSMMNTDLQPNRLERAKFKISDLLDANPRARIALIAYAGTAHTVVPLSSDYRIIRSHLEGLSPQIMPFPGENLEAALHLADTLTRFTNAPGRIILFSDDINEESFLLLQSYILAGDTKIEIFPFSTSGDEGMKAKLNSLDGISVHRLTLDQSDVEALAASIAEDLEFREEEEKKEDDWLDRGLWFVLPFALFILIGFRRGRVVFSLLLVTMLSSCDGSSSFRDLWLTKDFQAQKAYNNADFELAAELFTDPMRKGVSAYKAGDYSRAIEFFGQDTSAMGSYNLGLAYFKNGNYAAANHAFGQALEMNPELDNARSNLELAREILSGMDEVDPEQIEEASAEESAQNIQNSDMEDLGGGGQEATKEDMEKERKEETAATDVRKGKELDEVPDNFESGRQDDSQKVLMRRVDDDPSLFLERKFAHQAKVKNLEPKTEKQK